MFKSIFDWILNRNLFVGWLDGYKLQIAGVLAGLALALKSAAPFLPPDVAVHVLAISEALMAIAGYFGVIGGIGRVASGPRVVGPVGKVSKVKVGRSPLATAKLQADQEHGNG